jgi:hypothetical protein
LLKQTHGASVDIIDQRLSLIMRTALLWFALGEEYEYIGKLS